MKYLFIFLFGVSFLSIAAQEYPTFNQKYALGELSSLITNIIVTDSCYYTHGLVVLSFTKVGSSFCKLDLTGNLLEENNFYPEGRSYEFWFSNLIENEKGFFNMGISVDSTEKALFLQMDKFGNPDTAFFHFNPEYPAATLFRPVDIAVVDSTIWISASVQAANNAGNMQLRLYRLDYFRELSLLGTFGLPQRRETNHKILQTENKNLLVKSTDYFPLQTLDNPNWDFKTTFYLLDTLGNKIWEKSSNYDGLEVSDGSILAHPDGGYVYASQRGWFTVNINNQVWHQFDHVTISHLDESMEPVWETDFWDMWPSVWVNDIAEIVPTYDHSGFVMIYNSLDEHGFEDYPYTTQPVAGLIKVNNAGDSLWHRKIRYEANPDLRHEIFTMKATPDGGYIAAGRVTTNDPNGYSHAWVFKTDEYGCLVPGCQDSLDTSVLLPTAPPDVMVKLYPNPATDYLNVYFRKTGQDETGQFSLYDATGKLVNTFPPGGRDLTIMVDVEALPAGSYWLEYREADGRVLTTPFVKL